MAESISILDIFNPYATLINTFLTFITIMVSLFSIYLTNRNAKTSQGEALLRRCEPIQDPIAMVGEKFKTVWTLGYRVELIDFMATISIKYSDTSGRNYIQKFDIIFHKSGHADITNYAQPELSEE